MDNQLPLTPTPVLFRPQKIGQETDYILKFSVTLQTNGSMDLCVYPYIGFHVSMLNPKFRKKNSQSIEQCVDYFFFLSYSTSHIPFYWLVTRGLIILHFW